MQGFDLLTLVMAVLTTLSFYNLVKVDIGFIQLTLLQSSHIEKLHQHSKGKRGKKPRSLREIMKDKFCLPERKFYRGNGISSKVDQNSQMELPNEKCPFHLLTFTTSRSFGLDHLWSYLPGRNRQNGTRTPHYKFPFEIYGVPFTTNVDQRVFPSKWETT